ncbi:MAG: ABC transporter ATP-binding protein [Solirubrobacterales bacterium]
MLAAFEGVGKSFGDTVALEGLSFGVPEGSVCGLLGPNGSGKTTAIRLLLGLTRPDDGSTSLLGAPSGGRGFPSAIRQTGALVEGPSLYSRASARQNMRIQAAALGLRRAGPEIEDLLRLVGLGERAGTRSGGFSMGMKQRLGLAIALLGRPRLVILDEPTNGLDPSGIVEMRGLISRLPERGMAVLVSSHLLSEVELMCDRVTIINRGRLVADGTMSEVVGSSGGQSAYRVNVADNEVPAAVSCLVQLGLSVEPKGDGLISVSGPVTDGSQLSCVLAAEGIFVSGLSQVKPDLEDVFLSLTDGDQL